MSDKDCLLIHLSRIICGNLLRTYWDLFAIDTPEQFDLFIQICVAILAYKLLLTFKSCPIYMHITWRYRTWWYSDSWHQRRKLTIFNYRYFKTPTHFLSTLYKTSQGFFLDARRQKLSSFLPSLVTAASRLVNCENRNIKRVSLVGLGCRRVYWLKKDASNPFFQGFLHHSTLNQTW